MKYARKVAVTFPLTVENISRIANPNLSVNVYTGTCGENQNHEQFQSHDDISQQNAVELMCMKAYINEAGRKAEYNRMSIAPKIKIEISKLKTAAVA